MIESKRKEDQFSATTALEVMTQRSDFFQFNNPDPDSSGTDSDSAESDDDQKRSKTFFQDIERIKRTVVFDRGGVSCRQNRVKFGDLTTKESEMHTKARRKTSSNHQLRLLVPAKATPSLSPTSHTSSSRAQFPSESSPLYPK